MFLFCVSIHADDSWLDLFADMEMFYIQGFYGKYFSYKIYETFNIEIIFSLTMSPSIFILQDQVLVHQKKVPEEEEVGIVEKVSTIVSLTAQTV